MWYFLNLLVKAVSCGERLKFTAKVCSYVFSGGFTPVEPGQTLGAGGSLLENDVFWEFDIVCTWWPHHMEPQQPAWWHLTAMNNPVLMANFWQIHPLHLHKTTVFSCFYADWTKVMFILSIKSVYAIKSTQLSTYWGSYSPSLTELQHEDILSWYLQTKH